MSMLASEVASLPEAWDRFVQTMPSSPPAMPFDMWIPEVTEFVGKNLDELQLKVPKWYLPLLRNLSGVKALRQIQIETHTHLGSNYSFFCDFIVALRHAFFFADNISFNELSSCLCYLGHLNQSIDETYTMAYNAIFHLVRQTNHHQLVDGQPQPQPQPQPDLSAPLQPLYYETDFAPEFHWFRHYLSKYSPTYNADLPDMILTAIAQPFIPTPRIPNPMTLENLRSNELMNSYIELEYYQSLPTTPASSQSAPISKPKYIQFGDYSNIPHPVLSSDQNAMSTPSILFTESYKLYFFWMFVIGEPNTFKAVIDQLSQFSEAPPPLSPPPPSPLHQPPTLASLLPSTTPTKSDPVHPLRKIAAQISIIENCIQRMSPSLTYQIEVLNYRLSLLGSQLPEPIHIPPLSTTHESHSLLDPMLFSLPTNSTSTISYFMTCWKPIVPITHRYDHFKKFISWICSLSNDFSNAWYLCCFDTFQHVASTLISQIYAKKGAFEASNCEGISFLRQLIEHTYTQYTQNVTTVYQHLYSRSIQMQLSGNEKENSKGEDFPYDFLSLVLFLPFFVFSDDSDDGRTLIQKHIVLSTHSGFLNLNTPISQLDSTNDARGVHVGPLHRALIPFSAITYTWLLVKSGLQMHFESPIGEGASNCFYHALDARYRGLPHDLYLAEFTAHVSPTESVKFSTPNNINLVPNPLLDQSDQVIKQIRSMIVDTDGEIWVVEQRERNTINTPVLSELADSSAIKTYQFNDPFSHIVPLDLKLKHQQLDVEAYDVEFFSKWSIDYVSDRITQSHNRPGFFAPIEPWTAEHSNSLRSWISQNVSTLVKHLHATSQFSILFPLDLEQIHTNLSWWLRDVRIGVPVDYNYSFPLHRFDNPNNDVENALVASESNQALLDTPQIKQLKQKYVMYLKQLSQAESNLTGEVMKVVLLNADAAGLFEQTNSLTNFSTQKCYPFPSPISFPNYQLSNAIPTQPDAIQYHRGLSKWCIEMLLISSLRLQPITYLTDPDHQFNQLRPQRFDPHPQSPITITSELVELAIKTVTDQSHQESLISSIDLPPLPPFWILRVNRLTDPLFHYDDFLYRISSTTLKCYETLFSLSE